MKIYSYSNTAQFSQVTTELDKNILSLVDCLSAISIEVCNIALQAGSLIEDQSNGQLGVASFSSIELTTSLLGLINRAKDRRDEIKSLVKSGVLLKFDIYSFAKETIDDSSASIERNINTTAKYMDKDPSIKEAYYKSIKVMFEYRNIILSFNKSVVDYNGLHNTNLTGASTSFSFFKMNKDLMFPNT